jgi:ribosome-associated heat shock protein Hsp15
VSGFRRDDGGGLRPRDNALRTVGRFDEINRFSARKRMPTHSNPYDSPAAAVVRLDIWLWAARFFKTRSLAKQAIEGGKVAVNDAPGKPSKAVHAGDRLAIRRGEESLVVDVVALSEKRGPAAAAQALYRETEASRTAREALREQRRMQGPAAPATKPDKRARRLIRALGDIDAF